MTQLEANGIAGPGTTFDEMTAPDGTARPEYLRLCQTLRDQDRQELARRHLLGRRAFRDHGITFSVSHGDHGIEKLFPFDPIPRIIDAASWGRLERGLKQRARALNAFLDDVYGEQRILRQGVVPPEIVLSSSGFRRELLGLQPPGRVRAHIAGIDLVRDEHGRSGLGGQPAHAVRHVVRLGRPPGAAAHVSRAFPGLLGRARSRCWSTSCWRTCNG